MSIDTPSTTAASSVPLVLALGAHSLVASGRTVAADTATLDDLPLRAVDLAGAPARKTRITDVIRETTDDD